MNQSPQEETRKSVVELGKDSGTLKFLHHDYTFYASVDSPHLPHRVDAPAIEFHNGDYEWHLHGRPHRVGAPAIKRGTITAWCRFGQLHNEDGPAYIDTATGEKQYWVRGCQQIVRHR